MPWRLRRLLHVLESFLLHQFLLRFHLFDLFFHLVLALIVQYDVHVLHEDSENLEILNSQQVFQTVEHMLLRQKLVIGKKLPKGPQDTAKLHLFMSAHDRVCKDFHDKFLVIAEYFEPLFHFLSSNLFLIGSENEAVGFDEWLDRHLPVWLRLKQLDEVIHVQGRLWGIAQLRFF